RYLERTFDSAKRLAMNSYACIEWAPARAGMAGETPQMPRQNKPTNGSFSVLQKLAIDDYV
ncbi:MAG TPA: hypothetical protein VHK27_02180, partial [Gammaproteobacteria bacterium]|nr:hypothetical protein [Gammaproteobacteria bacterium]